MNARYYVGAIGRFASADTIVPNPANPQSFNRYSYVRNSPLNLVDPTGHEEICGDTQCNEPPPSPAPPPPPPIPTGPMVTFNVVDGCTSPVAGACEWSQAEMDTITAAAIVTGTKLAETLNATHPGWDLSAEEAFLLVYGGSVSFLKMGGDNRDYWGETFLRDDGRHEIEIYGRPEHFNGDVHWAVHELGHAFVNAVAGKARPILVLDFYQKYTGLVDRTDNSDAALTWGFHGGRYEWQRSPSGAASEEFADMYLGWVYDKWEMAGDHLSPDGAGRSNFMNHYMPYWVNLTVAN